MTTEARENIERAVIRELEMRGDGGSIKLRDLADTPRRSRILGLVLGGMVRRGLIRRIKSGQFALPKKEVAP